MKGFKEREGKDGRSLQVRGEEERWIAVEEGRDGGRGISPRVFGPCLSSSFVPKLRLFSWPSFSRFVHPWAQSRARVRKGD